MPRARPLAVPFLLVAAAALAPSCRSAEIEALKAENAALAAARDQQAEEAAERAAQVKMLEVDIAHARAEAKQMAHASSEERAAHAAALAEMEERLEKLEKAKGEVESHRDELVEWVDELLPLAEQQDPRLANLRQITDEMAKQVEEYRGLQFKRPFMRRLIHRDDVKKFMRRDMEREMPKEEADAMMRVMAEFGLVAPGTDLFDMFEGFMEAGAAAFYKPNTGTFYLIEGKNDRGDRPIVFHELVHALEDQHFDLTTMQRAFDGNSDASMGIKGLIEGSAERLTDMYGKENPEDVAAMMRAQATPEMMQRQMRMMQSVPTFLIAAMGLYPYKNGSAWLQAVGVERNEQLDRLFAEPPISTEQVLHPAKSGRDYPHAVAAPVIAPILGDGWESLDDDVMGELFCGLLLATNRWNPQLKNNMPVMMNVLDMRTQGVGFKGEIAKAAEGWAGDRYTAAIDRANDRVVVAWSSIWDSEEDAREFAEFYASLTAMRAEGGRKPVEVALPARLPRESDGSVSVVEVQARRVAIVLGAPAEHVDALVAATWAAEVTPDERDQND